MFFFSDMNRDGADEGSRLDLTAPTQLQGPRKLLKEGGVAKAKSGRKLTLILCNDVLVLIENRNLYRMVSRFTLCAPLFPFLSHPSLPALLPSPCRSLSNTFSSLFLPIVSIFDHISRSFQSLTVVFSLYPSLTSPSGQVAMSPPSV